MSEKYKSETELVDDFEACGYELSKIEKVSSENISFYDAHDNDYQEDAILAFFKDNQGNWCDLHFGQWYRYDSETYNKSAENRYIRDLKTEHHVIDSGGRIYYIKEGKPAEDTGFKRSLSSSHLDAAYLFKDSFVIDDKDDVIGDPDHDVYGAENITKNKLYKRQKDGSYKQIWESRDCIFQKEGFPDNVYFSGGSWRHPEMKTYFVDGQSDDSMKKKIEIAMKIEELRHVKDPLQDKQDAIEDKVYALEGRVDDDGKVYRRRRRSEKGSEAIIVDPKKIKVGKTGDSSKKLTELTKEEKATYKEVAYVQQCAARRFMKGGK